MSTWIGNSPYCCGCSIVDAFDRTTDTIDPDGVNVLGQTRYVFNPSTWHVDTGTQRLVCDTTDEWIAFTSCSDVGKRGIYIEAYGFTTGQHITLTNGVNTLTLTVDATNHKVLANFDGVTDFRAMGTAPPYDLWGLGAVAIYLVDKNDTRTFSSHPSFQEITKALGAANDYAWSQIGCIFLPVDLSTAGSWQWKLKCSSGITFDNLTFYDDTDTTASVCTWLDYSCHNICNGTVPASITVTIAAGMVDTIVACFDNDALNSCYTPCFTAYNSCLTGCGSAHCACGCEQTFINCKCACNSSLSTNKTECIGAAWDGTYVLDFVSTGAAGSRCWGTCSYQMTHNFGPVGCASSAANFTLSATLSIISYNSGTGVLTCKIDVLLPFGPCSVSSHTSLWTTGNVSRSAICSGTNFSLTNTGPTFYNDQFCVGALCHHRILEPQNQWLRGCPGATFHTDDFTTTVGSGNSVTFPTGGGAGYSVGDQLELDFLISDGMGGFISQTTIVTITSKSGDTVHYSYTSGDPLPATGTSTEVSGTVDCFDPSLAGDGDYCKICPDQPVAPHTAFSNVHAQPVSTAGP